jgi:addiction module RelE/StbE family toxin
MPPPEKLDVKWELSRVFRETWKNYKKAFPEISKTMTEFDRCKRANPPERLPGKMKDHKLDGPLKGYMDCHLAADVILIYKVKPGGAIKLFLCCQHAELRPGPKAKALARRLSEL